MKTRPKKLQLYNSFPVLSLMPNAHTSRPESKNNVNLLPFMENQTFTLRDFCH